MIVSFILPCAKGKSTGQLCFMCMSVNLYVYDGQTKPQALFLKRTDFLNLTFLAHC